MAYFRLKCAFPGCDKTYEGNEGYRLCCDSEIDGSHGPSLLQCVYEKRQIHFYQDLPGIFPFIDWLPTQNCYIKPDKGHLGTPISYRSFGLAKRLGLKNLFIAFAGFWPIRGGNVITRSFKEYEVQASIVRYILSADGPRQMPLIVSSTGNTANAYNIICHQLQIPIYLVLPEAGQDKMVLPVDTKPFTIIVKGDYLDAMEVAERLHTYTGLAMDGGARNVGRRAGMGTVMLSAVAHPDFGSGVLFDHYFQAVGSGSGAIAAYEAVELLRNDSRFGDRLTKIHAAQNEPFAPIVDSFENGSRQLVLPNSNEANWRIKSVTAQVITNRKPAYSIRGGLYDVLTYSGGRAWRVDNYDLFQAARMFKETEGVDIGEASAVAVGALSQAVNQGSVKPEDYVLLNITGGGLELHYSAAKLYRVQANLVVAPNELDRIISAIGDVQPIDLDAKVVKMRHG